MASISHIQRELRNVMAKLKTEHDAPPMPAEAPAPMPEVPEAVTKFVSGFRVKRRVSTSMLTVKAPSLRVVNRSWLSACLESLDGLLPMVEPLGEFKVAWDTCMIAVVIATVILTPFQLAFVPRRRCDNPWTDGLEWFNLILDLALLGDCMLTFRTAVYVGHELSKDFRLIAKHYFRGWFALDFVASVPFNHLIYAMGGGCNGGGNVIVLFKTLKILKTFRLLRIFRLLKLLKQMDQWQASPNNSSQSDAVRFGRLVLIIVIMAHLGACALMFMANPERPNVLESKDRSWVTEFVAEKCDNFGASPGDNEHGSCAEPSTARLYIAALYWAVSTLTTVGYGDITPFTWQEMIWSIVIQFIGTCSLGYILGEVTSILTHDDKSSEMIREKIAAINEYMRYRKLPAALRVRIRSHYTHLWKQTTVWDEPQILDEMSGILRAEVMQYINNEKLRGMLFVEDLGGIGDEAMAQLSLRLTPQMANAGEPIIKEHQFGKDTYILDTGHAEALFYDENIAESLECEPNIIVKLLPAGDYFAEYTLFLTHEAKHPFTVRAVVPCELFSVTREALLQIAKHFPSAEANFLSLVEKRHKEMLNILSNPKHITLVGKDPPMLNTRVRGRPSMHFRFHSRRKLARIYSSSDVAESSDSQILSSRMLEKKALALSIASQMKPPALVRLKLWGKKAVLTCLYKDRVSLDGFPLHQEGRLARRISSHNHLIKSSRRKLDTRSSKDNFVSVLKTSSSSIDNHTEIFNDLLGDYKDPTPSPETGVDHQGLNAPSSTDSVGFRDDVLTLKQNVSAMQRQLDDIARAVTHLAAQSQRPLPNAAPVQVMKDDTEKDKDREVEHTIVL